MESGPVALPAALDESSGVAVGRRIPGGLWTHNDQGDELFVVDREGTELGRWRLDRPLRDWEDVEVADCPAGSCLYLADTGDNAERRTDGDVSIVRLPEPSSDTPSAGPLATETFPIRFPSGPRDVEALFVLPGERVYVVSKGRSDAVTVYRYPPPLRPELVTLEPVQSLSTGAVPLFFQVTGASAGPDGSFVGVRTYSSLQFYRITADTLARVDGALVNLSTLQEIQGEAVGIGPNGEVALTSEAGPFGGPASLRVLRCDLERLTER